MKTQEMLFVHGTPENRWNRIYIGIMIILIDSCNGNKQTNCNLLFSKDFIFEKSKHFGNIVERKEITRTKQSNPDFVVPVQLPIATAHL